MLENEHGHDSKTRDRERNNIVLIGQLELTGLRLLQPIVLLRPEHAEVDIQNVRDEQAYDATRVERRTLLGVSCRWVNQSLDLRACGVEVLI